MDALWTITETEFNPAQQHHKETVFTTGNGYLATRGAFEEGFPNDRRATFLHGVFDAAPLVITELANMPDWLPLVIVLNGERFTLQRGQIEAYERALDLQTGVLTRRVTWTCPKGNRATITFERFASLADEHALLLRVTVLPEFNGIVEFRAGLNGYARTLGAQGETALHWAWLDQCSDGKRVILRARTIASKIKVALAMRWLTLSGRELDRAFWDVENEPRVMTRVQAFAGEEIACEKYVGVYTSRDVEPAQVVERAVETVNGISSWRDAYDVNASAWQKEWARTDVIIEGDAEAQLALRFNLFQMLIAAPRHDDRVSIGAKTLSGFGYRGHAFWDTEIFMLPLFIYTAPPIAKNLLNYRYRLLDAARTKARANGFEGAQFPWESADTGEEVTPTWIPHYADRTELIRIWTGDIEIHISADIAYAAQRYWIASGDDEWMIEKGAELILDTAKFWASRAEWNMVHARYEYNDVIGPDEYHEHVNNNFYTNRMAQWNLQTALFILAWLKQRAPQKAEALTASLDLTDARLAKWRDVIEKIYLPMQANGLILQFDDYLARRDLDLAALEPRALSVQQQFGIAETNQTQVLKQPDVLMLLYLLRDLYADEVLRVNYEYYTPRTDVTFGSSLGPAIQAIMACQVGKPDEAYAHFMRALRADLYDVRGNANDGIHAASAGGSWQAAVFGFGGLRVTRAGWTAAPRLPKHWTRLAFKFFYRGELETVDFKGG